jgi:hypothetical protein
MENDTKDDTHEQRFSDIDKQDSIYVFSKITVILILLSCTIMVKSVLEN